MRRAGGTPSAFKISLMRRTTTGITFAVLTNELGDDKVALGSEHVLSAAEGDQIETRRASFTTRATLYFACVQ